MSKPSWMEENDTEIKSFVFRNLIATASHPLEYAKTLIQLGYEPFVPVETTGIFFGRKYLGLPNALTYLKYIKSVDGFFGCYRGLVPKLFYSNIYYVTHNKVNELCPYSRNGEENEKDRLRSRQNNPQFMQLILDLVPADARAYFRILSWDVVSVSVGTFVSYPFHLIAVRSMAQFVGRETKFNSVISSIFEIYKNEGILGFFNGVFSRVLAEVLTVVIAGTCVFIITKHVSSENQQLNNLGSNFLAGAFSYQFAVTANNMAVNNSGLALGCAPYAKIYTSWYDCWVTLRSENQLSRGASLFARQYTGPMGYRNGKLTPLNYAFGPTHPRNLAVLEREYFDKLD